MSFYWSGIICLVCKSLRHWCSLLKGTNKTQARHSHSFWLTSTHQVNGTRQKQLPFHRQVFLHFSDPCLSGSGRRIIRTQQQVLGWHSPPQGKERAQSKSHWTSDSASGIYSLGCISDAAGLIDAQIKQKIIWLRSYQEKNHPTNQAIIS